MRFGILPENLYHLRKEVCSKGHPLTLQEKDPYNSGSSLMITICKVCEKKIMRGEKFRHCELCKEDFCMDCKSQLNIKQQEL